MELKTRKEVYLGYSKVLQKIKGLHTKTLKKLIGLGERVEKV